MNVVILATGPVPRDALGEQAQGLRVRSILFRSGRASDDDHVVQGGSGVMLHLGDRIAGVLDGNSVLRMCRRISPLDPGVRFWRALRRDAVAADMVEDADLLIAADRDAIFACWNLARQTGHPAVSGLAAGKRSIAGSVDG